MAVGNTVKQRLLLYSDTYSCMNLAAADIRPNDDHFSCYVYMTSPEAEVRPKFAIIMQRNHMYDYKGKQ